MDRPVITPTNDMLKAYAIGTIKSMSYNEDATDENRCEAEPPYGGHFTYEVVVDLVGEKGECSIGEETLKLIKLDDNAGATGCWILEYDTRAVCEEWLKWLRCEDKELKTYRRLQKKFSGV